MAEKNKPVRYDASMIRDFLEQLKLEVEISIFENQQEMGAIDEEYTNQLAMFHRRRVTVLLFANDIVADAATEIENRRAIDLYRAAKVQARERELEALRSLEQLFKEAITCIGAPEGQLPVKKYSASEILKAYIESQKRKQ